MYAKSSHKVNYFKLPSVSWVYDHVAFGSAGSLFIGFFFGATKHKTPPTRFSTLDDYVRDHGWNSFPTVTRLTRSSHIHVTMWRVRHESFLRSSSQLFFQVGVMQLPANHFIGLLSLILCHYTFENLRTLNRTPMNGATSQENKLWLRIARSSNCCSASSSIGTTYVLGIYWSKVYRMQIKRLEVACSDCWISCSSWPPSGWPTTFWITLSSLIRDTEKT